MLVNKDEKTLGKKQYHIHLQPGDIGKYVLLPGVAIYRFEKEQQIN